MAQIIRSLVWSLCHCVSVCLCVCVCVCVCVSVRALTDVRQVRCTFDIRYSAMERRTRLHAIFVAHSIFNFRLPVPIFTRYGLA